MNLAVVEPSYTEIRNCFAAGNYKTAIELAKRFLNAQENDPIITQIIAASYANLKDFKSAIPYYQACLDLKLQEYPPQENHTQKVDVFKSTLLTCYHNYAEILLDQDQDAKAILKLGQEIAQLDQEDSVGQNLIGIGLRKSFNRIEAKQHFLNQIAKYHENAIFWSGLGMVYLDENNHAEAKKYFKTACALEPDNLNFRNNYTITLYDLGKNQECISSINYIRSPKKLDQSIGGQDYLYVKAQAELRMGNWYSGWQNYETRWKSRYFPGKIISGLHRHLKTPKAKPDRLKGKIIMVYTEQGHGDVIMMMRLLPELAKLCKKLILINFHIDLTRLFETSPEIMNKVVFIQAHQLQLPTEEKVDEANQIAIPNHDYHCGIMSLPFLLNLTPQSLIPPCLMDLPQSFMQKWQDMLQSKIQAHGYKRLIGITASGNPKLKKTELRDIPLAKILSKFRPDDLILLIQKEQTEAQAELGKQYPNLWFIGAFLEDYRSTSALIRCLDLVISVDSSVAHLAGSLHAKTFIMLPEPAEWRWMEKSKKSPWYPSALLIRQQKQHDWDSALPLFEEELNKIEASSPKHFPQTVPEIAQNYFHQGQFQLALDCLQPFLSLYPNHSFGLQIKALSYASMGGNNPELYQDALTWFEAAIHQQPGLINLRGQAIKVAFILAQNALIANDYSMAIGYAERILRLEPNNLSAIDLLSRYLRLSAKGDRVKLARALSYATIWMNLSPMDAEAYSEAGLTASKLQKWQIASKYFSKAIELDSSKPLYKSNYAITLMEQGHYRPAQVIQAELAKSNPEYQDNLFAHGISSLTLGDYEAGWKGYELRSTRTDPSLYQSAKWHQAITLPEWRGEKLPQGKTLLIITEQGLGDSIMLTRYLPLIHKQGIKIRILTNAIMKPLLSTVKEIESVHCNAVELHKLYDYYILMASLPFAFNTKVETIPPPLYFDVSNSYKEKWQNFFSMTPNTPRKRIGFVYEGGNLHGNNHLRSLGLRNFLILKQTLDIRFPRGIEWICLQKEINPKHKEILSQIPALRVLDDKIEDFQDSAAILHHIDLVITIDSAMAHLAASQAVETFLFITHPPDFRWLLERKDSPWYPNILHIYRQNQPHQWDFINEDEQGKQKPAEILQSLCEDIATYYSAKSSTDGQVQTKLRSP